jgi:fructose-1,6-bisphosphatase/inositol monophosphatase family enzyme
MFAEEGSWRDDKSRFEKPFHWQLDPIDGTKGFKDETGNFGISLALVSREGRSFVGVLHNPARNLLAYACVGQAAILNNAPIRPSSVQEGERIRIIVSSNQIRKPNMARALDLFSDKETVDAESNVTKAIRVFSGEADLFFGLPHVAIHSWDLAAISIIAESSGCVLTDFQDREINLNTEETIWPHGFVLSNGHIHDFAIRTLSQWKEN